MKRHKIADFGKRQSKMTQKMSFRTKGVAIMFTKAIIEIAVWHKSK